MPGQPITLAVSADALYGVAGFIEGVAATINTDRYISAVVNYTHATLAEMCDFWIDMYSRSSTETMRAMQHVYEWPTEFQAYSETVGNPMARLWRQTLSGQGRNKVASFRFIQSKVPSPVNPTLTTPGKKGATVKEGVHIFHWKAKAMEYGIEIKVTPKLAKYLAYAADDATTDSGVDNGLTNIRLNNKEDEGSGHIAFSEGPVEFTAGGGLNTGQFTSAFVSWWQSQAGIEFDTKVKPRLEADIFNEAKFNMIVKKGNAKEAKAMSLTGASFGGAASWQDALNAAKADLEGKANGYIEMARQRRLKKYGDSGYSDEERYYPND
jgi:hypothetical protein